MKYFLSIIAIFKNESMVIKEWIEQHLWQGVEHFYLIDNESDDDYLNILKPYIDKGIVTLYVLPGKHMQEQHYNSVFDKIKNDTLWLMIIDVDEYFFGVKIPLNEYLKSLSDEHSTIKCYWDIFGSSGYEKQPEEIRTSFVYCMETEHIVEHSKNIVKPEYVSKICVHTIRRKKQSISIEDNQNIKLFHYQIMSKEYFNKVKIPRGSALKVQNDLARTWDYFNIRDSKSTIKNTTLSDLVKNGY